MESSHTKWTSASSSILFIGSLLQHCRKNLEVLQTRRHSYTDELKDFIKDMKEQTKEISTELEKEGPRDHRWLIRRGSESGLIPRSIPKANKVIKVTGLVASMLVFLFMSQWLCKLRVKKCHAHLVNGKGGGYQMLHLGFTLLVSFTLYLSILDSLNEILKKISVIIYRKWQYAQRRFNRMETFFYILQVSDDVYCEVCQCRFRKADKQYPCRICEGVFHRECVLGITDVHPSHASTIERASVKIGWSCPACVSYIHM